MQTISRDELKKKIDRKEKFLLLETLAPAAYEHAPLPGAINLPPEQLQELAPKIAPDNFRVLAGGNGLHQREGLFRGKIRLDGR